MPAFVYVLECADSRYYVGSTRGELETRVAEHNAGTFGGYTFSRRPVKLVYSEFFENIMDAVTMERRIKGWSRIKKEALINGDFERIKELAKRRTDSSS
jgi:putative endonuclease